MPTSEEKIKLFFSDTTKVESLIKDTEFMDKVSNGTASTETYEYEFKKLGLELSKDELEEVKTVVTKLINAPAKELEDISLENISGGIGINAAENLAIAGVSVGGIGTLAAVGTTIASLVCYSKAKKSNNKSDQKKFSDISKKLAIAAGACGGTAVAGFVGAAVSEFGIKNPNYGSSGDPSLFEDGDGDGVENDSQSLL